jgi:ABC-type cobalamin transport system ATPase subunit
MLCREKRTGTRVGTSVVAACGVFAVRHTLAHSASSQAAAAWQRVKIWQCLKGASVLCKVWPSCEPASPQLGSDKSLDTLRLRRQCEAATCHRRHLRERHPGCRADRQVL